MKKIFSAIGLMLVFSQVQAEVSNVIDYYFDQRFDYYEQGW